jgi:ketosteroid isomerase-like protein
MSAADSLACVSANFDAFNARDLERGGNMLTPSAELLDVPSGQRFVGPDGLRQYWQGWYSAFSDGKVEVVNNHAGEDGTVVTEFIGRGTHDGTLVGPGGQSLPATGRQVDVRFCQVATVRDNKITDARLYWDMMTMLGQLGALPTPVAAGA